ncbi:MAG: cytochrome c3 family protein [Nitrospirota bacterium]
MRDIVLPTLMTVLAVLLAISLTTGDGRASIVSDQCEVCHSRYTGMMGEASEDDMYEQRNAHCVNCHSDSGAETIMELAGLRVPVVYSLALTTDELAGGNFHSVAMIGGDRSGHNVSGIAAEDAKYGPEPPGYERDMDPSLIGYNRNRPLFCAGSNGCHGDRNIMDPLEAILGTHHAVDRPVDGKTTAKSYRYLKNTALVNGVVGLEDDDWERTRSVTDHNEYSPSINEFCTSCHGDLHGSRAGSNKVWFRHPTGIPLPKRGEYLGYEIYNTNAPVGREKVPETPSSVVEAGSDIVICVSCHMAHSGPYASILRWDYDNIFAGKGKGGCFICHTSKAGK